jgi:hypothetical protein
MARQIWVETVVTSKVDGPTLTAAAAASMLPASAKYTFPPDTLNNVGKVLRITATGRVSTVITTPGTLRFDVRLQGNVVFDSQGIFPDSTAAYVNVGWYMDLFLTVQIDGTAAQMWGQGKFACTAVTGLVSNPPQGALSAILPFNASPGLGNFFDATQSQQFDMFFTQTVGTGSLTCHQLAVELTN